MGRGLATKTIALRNQCYDILAEIQPATVRAVCYRLFVMKAIPNMSKNSTNKVSGILSRARKEAHIPWAWIVDEGRELELASMWEDPAAYAQAVKHSYRRDRWEQQLQRVEIWSEKGTMRGTLQPVLDTYGVGFRVMHGYTSTTVLKDIAEATNRRPVPLRVFYLGDWDPSGMHMSEVDLPRRLAEHGANVHLTRLALTKGDQQRPDVAITAFPATDKRTDARYQWFTAVFGDWCWELDALNPVIVRDRVEAAITSIIDYESWDRYDMVERAELASLDEVLSSWVEQRQEPVF